ncbi:MAG: ABC transporter permease, partial [Thermoguttaceae bacterium]
AVERGMYVFQGPIQKKGGVTGLIRNHRLTMPRDLEGRPIRIPEIGLAMSKQLADFLHVKRGDTVAFTPIKGLKQRRQVPVMEISESYFGTSVYADIHYLNHLIDEENALNGVQIVTDRNAAHREAMFRQLKQMPALQSIAGRADMVRALEETVLKHQWIVIDLFIIFAGIVFFGSILNASLVSLAERQCEVATLRVLGYSPWMIGSMLFRESMITAIFGALLGMPLGYLLTAVTAEAYASDMFRMPVIVSPGIWLWTMFYAILFALLTHLAVQRAINRMDWLDALKVRE